MLEDDFGFTPFWVVSQFEISAPWVESGPLVIGHTDKCDAQIVSNVTVRRRLKLFWGTWVGGFVAWQSSCMD
jgi:hypothetical protein